MNSTKNIFLLTHLDYICSDSRVVPHAGLVIPGQILDAIGFDKAVNKSTPVTKEYKNSEILKAMLICILCGNADYDSIHETDDDQEYYCNAMRMTKIPSEATMRQRMDDMGETLKDTLKPILREATVNLFKYFNVNPTALENGYVPVDIDVSPFINEKCHNEGISKTYKLKDGYAPIFAYIGTEGYLLACELREGKQHCQKDTPAFLKEVIELARKITDKPLLVRLDSGNDAAENIGIFMEKCYSGDSIHFIVKRNIRKENPAEWLENFREVCTNVSNPREGKSVYIGETLPVSGHPGLAGPSVRIHPNSPPGTGTRPAGAGPEKAGRVGPGEGAPGSRSGRKRSPGPQEVPRRKKGRACLPARESGWRIPPGGAIPVVVLILHGGVFQSQVIQVV